MEHRAAAVPAPARPRRRRPRTRSSGCRCWPAPRSSWGWSGCIAARWSAAPSWRSPRTTSPPARSACRSATCAWRATRWRAPWPGLAGFASGQLLLAFFANGAMLNFYGFVPVALGGLGNNRGAVIGGLALGLFQQAANFTVGGVFASVAGVRRVHRRAAGRAAGPVRRPRGAAGLACRSSPWPAAARRRRVADRGAALSGVAAGGARRCRWPGRTTGR